MQQILVVKSLKDHDDADDDADNNDDLDNADEGWWRERGKQ